MTEKVNIQDLINLLAGKHGIEKDVADIFVKDFFSLIEEGLRKDRYVKIKGFGTFKLVDVESRESIDVNTGERIQIQGHTKVSFTPDTAVRDTINKPFAHFETVVLSENVSFDDSEKIEDTEALEDIETVEDTEHIPPVPPISEVTPVDSGALENTEELIVISTPPVEEEIIINEIPEEPEETVISTKEELITQPTENRVGEEIPEVIIEESVAAPVVIENSTSLSEETPQEEIIIASNEIIDENNESSANNDEGAIVPPPVANKNKEKKTGRIIFQITALVFIILLGVFFIYFHDKDKLFGGGNGNSALTESTVSGNNPADAMVTDSTAVDSVKNELQASQQAEQEQTARRSDRIVPTPAVPPVYDPYLPVYADSTSYKIIGTKANHKLKRGETLVKISLRYYGTKDLWPYLVMNNRKKITNPNSVPIGTIIDIPELELK